MPGRIRACGPVCQRVDLCLPKLSSTSGTFEQKLAEGTAPKAAAYVEQLWLLLPQQCERTLGHGGELRLNRGIICRIDRLPW